MDFFAHQEQARRRSGLLKWYFALAVAGKVILLCLVLGTVIQLLRELSLDVGQSGLHVLNTLSLFFVDPPEFWKWFWHPVLLAFIAGIGSLSVLIGSVWQVRALERRGAKSVAELLGGRRLGPAPKDAGELRLRRVVEEMAIASSLPVPEIFVLDREPGLNAFSAGFMTNDVAIGVTRGCVRLFSRDALQGVVAHEFSHILKGDTRLNMELMGLVHGLLWPAIIGRVMVHGACATTAMDDRSIFDEDTVGRIPEILGGYCMIALGLLGVPFVRAVKSALCRQREFLADAAAVQFTRSNGIAEALKKVGGLYRHGRLNTSYAEMASHLYFVSCHMNLFLPLLASHPPLARRVRAVEPDWDGEFTRVDPLKPQPEVSREAVAAPKPAVATPKQVLDRTGQVSVESLALAATVRAALSPEVQFALSSPDGATTVVYALLLSPEDVIRTKQMTTLRQSVASDITMQALRFAPDMQDLDVRFRLPVVDLAVPALRHLDQTAHDRFLRCVEDLIEADGAIDLFEYAVRGALLRRLRLPGTISPVRVEFDSEKPVLADCGILLSALAQMDRNEPGKPEAAFERGSAALSNHSALKLLPREECNLPQMDAALNKLVRAAPTVKRKILLACGLVVAADEKIEVRELELLRAIADALECPIPPFVEAMEEL